MFIIYKQLLYYIHDNFLRLRFLWVNCQVCSTLAIWRGAVHTDAIICVSPPVQDSFALFFTSISVVRISRDPTRTLPVDTLCQITKIGFPCHVLHSRLYSVLFLATNASCVLTSFSRQWTTGVRGHHIAHIVYVPLCVCVSPSALVFLCLCIWVSLCLCCCFSVLVSSIWFPFPALCLSAWSKNHFCLHFKIKTFQWKESISTPLAPTLVVELLSMPC